LQNFSLDLVQNIGVIKGETDFDLHNDYNLESFHYDVLSSELTVNWQIDEGDWIQPSLPRKLTLKFHNISFLQIIKNETDDDKSDDGCLEMIGLSDYNMRSDYKSVLAKQTSANNDIILIFLNGQSIRVNAESVELILEAS